MVPIPADYSLKTREDNTPDVEPRAEHFKAGFRSEVLAAPKGEKGDDDRRDGGQDPCEVVYGAESAQMLDYHR